MNIKGIYSFSTGFFHHNLMRQLAEILKDKEKCFISKILINSGNQIKIRICFWTPRICAFVTY